MTTWSSKLMKNSRMLTTIVFAFLYSTSSHAISTMVFKPESGNVAPPDYKLITDITTGGADYSILDDRPGMIRGRFYRLIFVNNEDNFLYPTLRIEELVYFDAGCCRKINKTWLIDFGKLKSAGIPLPAPEYSATENIKWNADSSVIFEYGGEFDGKKDCKVTGFGKTDIEISCK